MILDHYRKLRSAGQLQHATGARIALHFGFPLSIVQNILGSLTVADL